MNRPIPNLDPEIDAPPTPMGLSRVASAANLANISPALFEKGLEDGTIPLEVIRIGKRFKYVRSTELGAWLSGRKTS